MENFDRENIDELLEIRQYFPPSKFCAVRYLLTDKQTDTNSHSTSDFKNKKQFQ